MLKVGGVVAKASPPLALGNPGYTTESLSSAKSTSIQQKPFAFYSPLWHNSTLGTKYVEEEIKCLFDICFWTPSKYFILFCQN